MNTSIGTFHMTAQVSIKSFACLFLYSRSFQEFKLLVTESLQSTIYDYQTSFLSHPCFTISHSRTPQRLTFQHLSCQIPRRTFPISPSLPPLINPLLNLIPCNPIPNQPHSHPQSLGIAVPRLVVEKQHILVPQPRLLMKTLEMPNLTAGVDLYPAIKHIKCPSRLLRLPHRRGRIRIVEERRRDV